MLLLLEALSLETTKFIAVFLFTPKSAVNYDAERTPCFWWTSAGEHGATRF
jgi:hypothetical protein